MTVLPRQGDTAEQVTQVGQLAGQPVHAIQLIGPDGSTARVLTWGAVLQDLRIALPTGRLQPVVLGFENFDDYPAYSPYFGAIVGRYANRISGGGFWLDNTWHRLAANEANGVILHGGTDGFSQRIWTVVDRSPNRVTLALHSRDGEEGFPGEVNVECTYRLTDASILSLECTGTTTAPTFLNLTQHAYFNLDGSADVSQHLLRIAAEKYTPVGEGLIPTGQITAVAGSKMDFRHAREVSDGLVPLNLDHNFILTSAASQSDPRLRVAAELAAPAPGLRMTLKTSKPGLQVYDGHKLNVPVPGHSGMRYAARAGICLEPQFFPDSPHQPGFPCARLNPEERYHHLHEYQFAYRG